MDTLLVSSSQVQYDALSLAERTVVFQIVVRDRGDRIIVFSFR